MKTYQMTEEIQLAVYEYHLFEQVLPKIMNQSFWQHKVAMKEKIEFMELMTNKKRQLKSIVDKQYPELKFVNYSIQNNKIIVY